MELTIIERITLLNLPWTSQTGGLMALKILREFREELSFDEEENARLKFVQEGGRVTWTNQDKDGNLWPDKEIEPGEFVVKMVAGMLEKLDEQKMLRDIHVDLCAKFGYDGLPDDIGPVVDAD